MKVWTGFRLAEGSLCLVGNAVPAGVGAQRQEWVRKLCSLHNHEAESSQSRAAGIEVKPFFQGHWSLSNLGGRAHVTYVSFLSSSLPPSLLSFLPSFLNWSLLDLQYCVSYRCRAKWFSYLYFSISDYFSIIGYFKILILLPALYSKSLFIYFVYSGVSGNPILLIYPLPLSTLVTISLFSMSVSLFLFCKFICIIF